MGMNKADLHDSFKLRRTYGRFDDFDFYVDAQFWTKTLNGSATVAVNSGDAGILTMSAIDSSTNRELYVGSTVALFLVQANKAMIFEADVQFTQANVNNIGVMFGISDAVSNGMIADTTLDAKSSFSGAVIYTKQGSTLWQTCSSNVTTQYKNTSTKTAGNGSTYQRLRIEIEPVSSTLAEVTYWVDGVQLQISGGRPGTSFIKDQLVYTGMGRSKVFFGLKNGSSSAEVLNIDYEAHEMLARLFT
jgi:hypothetical protein